MIEILYFGLSVNRGGIETYLYKIARHIDRQKYHLNYIDMTGAGNLPCFYEELRGLGCEFYKITPRNVSVIKNREEMKALFHQNHFDVFHYNVNTLSYLLPVDIALKNNCKVLVHSRNAGSASTRPMTRLFHEINKSKMCHMKVTRIAVSEMAGKWLFGDTPFDVYHNGVDTDKFIYSYENRLKIRRALSCDNKTVIANVGVFTYAKNHPFMVDIFEEYLKLNPNSCMWFIGDGERLPTIQRYVKVKKLEDKILFLGKRSDLKELYAGMDLFLFPSLYEGFGNVLLEAQCEGVPCLLSDCIPQDARILDNTFSFSLQEPLHQWAIKIQEALEAQEPDRTLCFKKIEESGASVKCEITRLQKLYDNMLAE